MIMIKTFLIMKNFLYKDVTDINDKSQYRKFLKTILTKDLTCLNCFNEIYFYISSQTKKIGSNILIILKEETKVLK